MNALKPWHQVVVPHADIRKGRFDESVFAADLSDVRAERSPLEYRDPLTFFRKTHPTQGLVNLLVAVLSRLGGKGVGKPVIQIQTPFGGGKTHSLIALYHLFGCPEEAKVSSLGQEVLQQADVEAVPAARVAAFVGTAADPLKGRTPWGEIAYQLDRYELIQEHDQRRRAPGKELLHQILGDEPTLILMDEIASYAVNARDFADQVMVFFQQLTETVKVLKRCALIVTLPSSAPYGEQGERRLSELQRIFGRVEAIYTPVEGEEMYEVIRKRLFEELPDSTEARRVAEGYWGLYRQLQDDIPRQVREPAYRDKIRKAYPFHPELIDVLFDRWSTFPTFQRTRGVLRLLAEIVADLYKKQHPAPLIQPAHLDLANSKIRCEFLKHIGNEYEGVIASDIADGGAKARRIDQEMGSEYARFTVAQGLATAIFFGSFSAGERKGVGTQRLRVMVLQEGIPPALIGDALRRLEEELWYLHQESGLYEFRTQPNLNRIIVEREEAVREENIQEEIRRRLEQVVGRELAVTLWPAAPADVPDTKTLKLAVLRPEHAATGGSVPPFAEELLSRSGQTFRVYRNTILALTPDSGEWSGLRSQVKRYLALRSIKDDKALVRQLSEENRRTLESKLKDAEGGINFRVLAAYRHLYKCAAEGIGHHDLGLPTIGERISLAARVREYLQGQDLLVDRISPKYLLDKALKAEEKEKPIRDIMEAFLKYPHLPLLGSEEVVWQALAQGVREGLFGVRIGERIYFKEPLPTAAPAEAVLVREVAVPPPPPPPPPAPGKIMPQEIVVLLSEDRPVPVATVYNHLWAERSSEFSDRTAFDQSFREAITQGTDRSLFTIEPPGVAENMPLSTLREKYQLRRMEGTPPPPPPLMMRYRLHARIPWDKLSDFVRGVVMPLRAAGGELTVEVLLKADGQIKKETLGHKVRETLRQIGAEVIEEGET